MIDLEAAWQILDDALVPLPAGRVRIDDAVGRVSAEAVRAPHDLPPFDNSSMDGYAIRCEDAPAALRMVDETFAGDGPAPRLRKGEAVRIMTGAPVPAGADAIVPVEDAELRGSSVQVLEPVPRGRFIRRAGEAVAAGDVLVEAGRTLTAGDIGLLASAGVGEISACGSPRAALVVTGSELRAAGEPLQPGAVHDANGPLLRALATRAGYELRDHGIVADDRELLRQAIERAAADADVLVVSGGVSVGERDHVKQVVEEDLGGERLFWRVRMKPGKPLLCARTPSGCLVLGLPGNPVSALAGWTAFVAPALRRLAGDAAPFGPVARSARITHDLAGDSERALLATATLHYTDGESEGGTSVRVTPTGARGSAMVRSMATGNCFVHVAPGGSCERDSIVRTYPW